jgi:hypothetical protein
MAAKEENPMTPTRREFIQSLGMALASLALARCAPTPEVVVECYIIETVQVEKPKATPTVGEETQRLQRVRDCWLRLDWPVEQLGAELEIEKGKRAKQELTTEHRAALDELVASGEMSKDVADYVQLAFVSAVNHVFDSSYYEVTVIECYVEVELPQDYPTPTPTPTPQVDHVAHQLVTDYASGSGERLAQQAELLAELAATSDIDPDTVERAQSAIERDMTLQSATGRWYLGTRLAEAAEGTYDFPPVEEVDPDIPPEAAEAARFLVELLLEE